MVTRERGVENKELLFNGYRDFSLGRLKKKVLQMECVDCTTM